jgi:4-amino-4-deoxy-L-arabinose transferase-like glycosyltransferase
MREPAPRESAWIAETMGSRLLLLSIIAIALALRLPGLTESLWHDEVWSTRVMLGNVTALARTIGADVHPPFYAVVMFVWIRMFGDSEISVRMLPLICGLLTIVLTARLAAGYGWRRAAPVAALILAISPPHIWYSQEARHYSLLLLLLTAYTCAFHRIRQTHARRWYVACALLALCMVLTHYFAIAYVAAITLLALADPRARPRMLWIGGAVACVLAAFLTAKWRFASLPLETPFLRGFGFGDVWRLMFEWYVIGGTLGRPETRATAVRLGVLGVQLALLAMVVRGLFHSRVAPAVGVPHESRWEALARRWELALLLLVLPSALIVLGLLGAKRFYIERSALSSLPFFAIAIGIGAISFRSVRWRALSTALIAAFGAVVLLNYYAQRDEWTVYKPNADWRAAARWLSARRALSGPPVVVVALTPPLELLYYDEGFGMRKLEDSSTHAAATGDDAGSDGVREWLKRRFAIPVDPRRGRTGRVYMAFGPDVALVHRIMDREHGSEFFLARNRYWAGSSDRMIKALEADPSLDVQLAFEAKGIRLLRIRPTLPHGAVSLDRSVR